MKICPNCNHENKDTSKFCEECGTKLIEAPKFCPECGTKLNGTPKFCPECGFNLSKNSGPGTATNEVKQPKNLTVNNDNFSTDFGTYDAKVPWNSDSEMDLATAVKFGNEERVKELIDAGECVEDLSLFDLSFVHNAQMLKFLWSLGNVNCYDFESKQDLMSDIIDKYAFILAGFRISPDPDAYKDDGDIFNSEEDIHNKYLGIIDFLLENEFDVNQILSCNQTPLMAAIRSKGYASCCLTRLATYLIEEWNADVNKVPETNPEAAYEYDSKWAKENGITELPDFEEYTKINSATPLILASETFSSDPSECEEKIFLCNLLLQHGADVNYNYFNIINGLVIKQTPLHNAIVFIDDYLIDYTCDLVSLFLKNNAEVTEEVLDIVREKEDSEARNKLCKLLAVD